MKLHWSPRSPYVRKVMVCAHECGIADRIDCVRTVVAMNKPNIDLLRSNPLGKIPTLVLDDGSVLYDSAVICEYFDSLHSGQKLFPPSGSARWTALRRHALGNNLIDNLILWRNELTRPDIQQSPEILAAFALKVGNAVNAIESEIDDIAATPPDIGQLALATALAYADFRFPDLGWREGRDGTAVWFDRFSQRPSMQHTRHVDA